jgi:site-specific DNA-methyltransferase (adenine-specific)
MNRTTTATTLDLHRGSAIEILTGLPGDHVDLVATDPPYGLTKRFDLAALLADWTSRSDHDTGGRGLMGHRWDGVVPGPATWAQVLRVLKPGGYAFVFAAPRTVDLMGLALRLAGFEIVDQIVWLHGNGWPKSRDVGAQIARKHPDLDEAADWDGWGTSLKPANEPIIVARKPLAGTVVDSVLTFGTGALHIDAGRIGDTGRFPANVVLAHEPGCRPLGEVAVRTGSGTAPTRGVSGADQDGNTSATFGAETRPAGTVEVTHRNPDGTETVDAWDCAEGCAVATLDAQSGRLKARGNVNPTRSGGGNGRSPASAKAVIADHGAGDWGGASRFFYCAKPSQSERNAGLDADQTNEHPSVKPVALMRYLIELAARPGAVVLDPYLGSGTTAVAAAEAGVNCVGVDRDDDGLYLPVAAARARHAGASVETYGWEPEAIAS